MTRSKLVLAAAAVAASVLALTGCAGATTATQSSSGAVRVVASTNVYGQIAEAIGGEHVQVTSIISSTSQDPHEFEAAASDQLAVQRAQLLIENGGGYDPFLDDLAHSAGTDAPIVAAAELSPAWAAASASPTGEHDNVEGFNEHVFYDPSTMKLVADRIAADLGRIDPANADDYTANAATFASGVAELATALGAIEAAHAGAEVFVTEPLPLYLTEAAGLVNATPSEFSEAVEEGQDVPPATLLDALGAIRSGAVKLVITNAQAGGAETTQVEDAAKAAGVPTLAFSEILPDGTTYLGWMQDNVDALAKALG